MVSLRSRFGIALVSLWYHFGITPPVGGRDTGGEGGLGVDATASRSRPPAQSAGQPWENGSIESFNGKLGDEPFNLEIFDTL